MYNLTYTELFFTDTLWPDFSEKEFNSIINQYLKLIENMVYKNFLLRLLFSFFFFSIYFIISYINF